MENTHCVNPSFHQKPNIINRLKLIFNYLKIYNNWILIIAFSLLKVLEIHYN